MLYNKSIVSVNGNEIEEFFLDSNKVVFSRILYTGNTHADAVAALPVYWHAPIIHDIHHTVPVW